ncbi:MAG: ChaN family lipoprotein [Polyangiaceae bacterium]
MQKLKGAFRATPWLIAAISLALTACGRPTAKAPEDDAPPAEAHDAGDSDKPEPPRFTAIELPAPQEFHGVRVKDGSALSVEELLTDLTTADVLCVGEQHDDVHHHWAQYLILNQLIERRQMNGRGVAVGLEMVSRRKQPALNRWSTGETKAKETLEALDWNQTWGYDFGNYAPIWWLAKQNRVAILGLNLEQDMSRKIARVGLKGLTPEERARLPREMNLRNRAHRAYFEQAMAHHPPPVSSRRKYYEAQVAWDETMAETANKWLVKQAPASQLLILAGLGHCQNSAIPDRIRRRNKEATVISVRPWREGDEPGLPKLLEEGTFDYVLVMSREDKPSHRHGGGRGGGRRGERGRGR